MPGSRRIQLLCLVSLTALVLALAGLSGSASAATTPTWSSPAEVTTTGPFSGSGTLNAISCADTADCFAGDVNDTADGAIYASGDGGQGWAIQRAAQQTGGGPFTCAPSTPGTAPFCISIAFDQVQNLSVPGAPVTGPPSTDISLELAKAISCPSSTLCVTAGGNGAINYSTSPLSGDWTTVTADPGHDLTDISCPGSGFCAAIDDAGAVVTSTTPTGAGAWTRQTLGPGLVALSCSTEQLCAAVSSAGQTFVSTDPASGVWRATTVSGAKDLTSVSCSSASFCVADTASGTIYEADNPSDGDFNPVGSLGSGLGALSCPTAMACAVVDGSDVLRTANVLGGTSTWTGAPVAAWNPLAAVSCPAAGLCVAFQTDGRVLSSTAPLTAAGGWSIAPADTGGGTPVALDCPSTSVCFGVDSSGHLLWSSDPGSTTAPDWQSVRLDLRGAPVGLSCPTASFCAFADSAGRIFTSTDPTGGFGAWHMISRATPTRTSHGFSETLTALNCPSAGFCVATDSGGWIYTTNDPRGGASAWTASQIWTRPTAGRYALRDVSCPTAGNCTVLGTYAGWYSESDYDPDALGTYALTSTRPGGGLRAWSARHIDGGYVESDASTNIPGLATGLSCPTTSLCAMVDNLGTAVTNTAAAGSANWREASIDALAAPESGEPSSLTGVSCFAGGHCVAISSDGDRYLFGIGAGAITPTSGITYGG